MERDEKNMVTMRDLNVPGGRKDAMHREPANVGEPLAENWAYSMMQTKQKWWLQQSISPVIETPRSA